MSFDPDKLYKLLPAIHRIRDSEQGEPLRAIARAHHAAGRLFWRRISINSTTTSSSRPARHGCCLISAI